MFQAQLIPVAQETLVAHQSALAAFIAIYDDLVIGYVLDGDVVLFLRIQERADLHEDATWLLRMSGTAAAAGTAEPERHRDGQNGVATARCSATSLPRSLDW